MKLYVFVYENGKYLSISYGDGEYYASTKEIENAEFFNEKNFHYMLKKFKDNNIIYDEMNEKLKVIGYQEIVGQVGNQQSI